MESTAAVAEGSALGRMLNVLPAPGEVFQEIKERPVNNWNWVVPAVIWAVIGGACVLLLFSQRWAMAEMEKMQEKALDQQVERGKMKREDADRAIEMTKKLMPIFVKVGGTVVTAVYAFALPFFWGFVIWLLGTKVFRADFEYMKGVEAAGLASIIYVVAVVVSTLTTLAMGKFVYISAAFFLPEVDFTNKMHVAYAAVNPLYLWYLAVVATAVSKLSGASWVKAALWCFVIWALIRAVLIPLNMGQFVM